MSRFQKATKLYDPELVRLTNQFQRLQSCLVHDSIALDLEHVYHCEHDVTDGVNPGLVPPNTPRGSLPHPYFPEEEALTEVDVPEPAATEVDVPEAKDVHVEAPVEVPAEVPAEAPVEVPPVKPKMSFFDIIRETKRRSLVASVEKARLAPRRETQGAPSSLPLEDKTSDTV